MNLRRAIFCLRVGARSRQGYAKGSNSGFTLVELVVTLSIMGILSVFVAPSFNDWIKGNRIATEIETFRMMLNYARQEAITVNSGVTLDTANVSGNWSGDIQIYTDATKGGNSNYDSSNDTIIREWTANVHNLTIDGNSAVGNWISFNSRGRLNESGVALIAICDDRGKSVGQVISIQRMGRINVSAASDFSSLSDTCYW